MKTVRMIPTFMKRRRVHRNILFSIADTAGIASLQQNVRASFINFRRRLAKRGRNQLMLRSKTHHLFLALGLIAPLGAYSANFCVATNGGFGSGGTSYIAPVFTLPTANHCNQWSGFTKTASTVVLFSQGVACLAAGGKVLTLSISNTDPSFLGAGVQASDQIVLCPTGTIACPVSGQDQGEFGGTAAEQTCTTALLHLPATHD